MSMSFKPTSGGEDDLASRCIRDVCLVQANRSGDDAVEHTSRFENQETFCLIFMVFLTLLLWLILSFRDQEQIEENTGDDKAKATLRPKLPPGTTGWPIIGETIEFVLDGRKYFRTRRHKFGSIFRSHLCGQPTVVIIGAENVQKVLTASESSLIQSPPASLMKLFGQGALCSSVGKRHTYLQKSVIRLFTPRILSMFVHPLQTVIREHVTKWREAGTVMQGSDACRQMSLSLVYQCLFGFDLDRQEADHVTRLFETFNEGVFSFPLNLPGFAFYKAMQARKTLKDLIEQRKSTASSTTNRLSMLDILNSTGSDDPNVKGDIHEDAADLMLELVFGANQSTASAMCTTLIELSENQAVLRKLRQELIDQCVTPGDPIDYETIRRLSYANAVVKEVLRVQPPIAGAFRKTLKPFQIQDYVIPPGWMILYGITDTHEESTIFDDVLKFNPDRWETVSRTQAKDPVELDEEKPAQTKEGAKEQTTSAAQQTTSAAQQTTSASQQTTSTAQQTTSAVQQTTSATQQTTSAAQQTTTAAQQTTSAAQQTTSATRSINKYEYIPFGGGSKRFCVGESMAKMILVLFLVELAAGTKGWKLLNGRPQIKTAPFPFPKDNMPLLFKSHPSVRRTTRSA